MTYNPQWPESGEFQQPLESGVNIKTVNGDALLGSGNLAISAAAPPICIIPNNRRPNVRFGVHGRTGNTALTVTANRLYFTPVIIPYDITATRISVRVTTTNASNIRMGIYNNSSGNQPGTRLLDAGEISASVQNVREITINQPLTAGIYWLASVFAGTPGVNGATAITGAMGYDSASATTAAVPCWFRAFTYGALPADESAQGLTLGTTAAPFITVG